VLNTAVLTGRQVSQAMKVFIVSRAGKVADVTLQASCRSVEESVLKVSAAPLSLYIKYIYIYLSCLPVQGMGKIVARKKEKKAFLFPPREIFQRLQFRMKNSIRA